MRQSRAFCDPPKNFGLQIRLARPFNSNQTRGRRPSPAERHTYTLEQAPAHLQRLEGQQQPPPAERAPRGHARDQPGGHNSRQPGLVQARSQLRSCVRTGAISANAFASQLTRCTQTVPMLD